MPNNIRDKGIPNPQPSARAIFSGLASLVLAEEELVLAGVAAKDEPVVTGEDSRVEVRASGEFVGVKEDKLDVETEEPLNMKKSPLLKGFNDCPLLACVTSKCMMSEGGKSSFTWATQAYVVGPGALETFAVEVSLS